MKKKKSCSTKVKKYSYGGKVKKTVKKMRYGGKACKRG